MSRQPTSNWTQTRSPQSRRWRQRTCDAAMTTRVGDLLEARRPHRVDAARNFDSILGAARDLFAEFGTDVVFADVAVRAGVGIATLYRHFPTREDLAEAVYVAEVDALCSYGEELAATQEAGEALE